MKIVLAGSPKIALKAFKEVIHNFDVVAIITQPDKPKGRGLKMQETPVAILGKKYYILTFKPTKIIDIKTELQKLDFDLLLTFAYGQYIPTSILEIGKFKPVNIHGSLLPKYRGAAPIHHAILNGDAEIGITLIEMIKEMDAGDMFFKAKQPITEQTTTIEAFEIIANLAATNIVDWLSKIANKEAKPIPQNNTFSLAPKIEKSFAELKKELSLQEALRKIRGLNSFPGAFMMLNDKRLKIFNASLTPLAKALELPFKDGKLYVHDFQWEGKKRQNILMLKN